MPPPSGRGSAARNEELLRRVAARTIQWQFQAWGFGEAIALRGLLRAARALDDAEMFQFVRALLLAYAGREVGQSPAEHVAPGRELVNVYQRTGDEPLLRAARRLGAMHASFPCGPHGARMHRPDLSGWRRQIWADCMDNEAPFLVLLGTITGEQPYIDQGLDEITAYARLLQDEETGLLFHGHEEACGRNGQLWARGNGWALMGLIETLRLIPRDCPARAELEWRLSRLCAGLVRWQDESGLWHTVVADPGTYLESTLAAMVASSMPAAFEAGMLDEKQYGAMTRMARQAVMNMIADDGSLQLVTEATPVGEHAMYATRRFGVYPWGQGSLLLMLSEACE
jgi:unsaturated rhamnogalacturonyl hydrolase